MAPLPVAVPAEEKGTREATLWLPSAIAVKHYFTNIYKLTHH
jgi:hypothetical protein